MFVWIFWKESANYFSCQIFIQIYFELSIFIWNDNRLLIFLWLFLIRKNVLKTNTLWATHEQHICTATTYSLKKNETNTLFVLFFLLFWVYSLVCGSVRIMCVYFYFCFIFCLCGETFLFVLFLFFFPLCNFSLLFFFFILIIKFRREINCIILFFYLSIRCYTVCTHNRIRSPRLATFGRIETRWVREVGKFGPYLRYKDWLRRRLLALYVVMRCIYKVYFVYVILLLFFFSLKRTLMFHNITFENWHGLGESDCLIKT